MKKSIYLVFASMLLLLVGGISCSSDDENKNVEYFHGTRVQLTPKASLPAWLIEKADNLEADSIPYMIKKGAFQGETLYWIHIPASSCPGCDIFDAQGKGAMESGKITEKDNVLDAVEWEIVYSYPSLEESKAWWEANYDKF